MSGWRIGIDCRLAGLAHAGIGRYTAELVTELLHLGHKDSVHWVFFCRTKEQADELLAAAPKEATYTIIFADIQQYTLAEQLELPRLYAAAQLDLLHVPHFNVPVLYHRPVVITIHDLLWHEQRGSSVTTLSAGSYWFKYLGYRVVTSLAIQKARTIFVPTQHVANSVAAWYPAAKPKILHTPEGATTHLLRKHARRAEKTLLYVGSLYPHKNITVVLQALEQLPNWKLRIVGARSIFLEQTQAEVEKRNLTAQVSFLGKLSDDELSSEYAEATALIQPSHSEGFGLTGLEAIALGTPVLASDIPVFHEVYQDAALYFDPHNPASLCKTLASFSGKVAAFSDTTQKNVIKQYNWKVMAEMTYAAYNAALKP